MAEQQIAKPSPETIDPEIVFPDIFRIVTSIEMMLEHLDEIADSSEEHDRVDCTLFQVRELDKRLEAYYAALVRAEIKPKASKEAANG